MEAEIETLQFEVESLLYTADETQIIDILETLEITEDVTTKSKRQRVVLIRKEIENKLDGDNEISEKISILKNITSIIKGTPPSLDPSETEVIELQKQREVLRRKQEEEMNELLVKLDQLKTNSKTSGEKEPEKSNKTNAHEAPTHALLRREFKLAGQIGEPGQTDKLSFVSLTHQIDSGLKRGYKETEIIDAVIRSISPHSSFRSYVEMLTDLSLAKLRKILRVHYREKFASELYHQLATTFQDAKESPSSIVGTIGIWWMAEEWIEWVDRWVDKGKGWMN